MKKLAFLLITFFLAVFSACGDTPNRIIIGETDDAVSAAYDVLKQVNALLSPEYGKGFDADIEELFRIHKPTNDVFDNIVNLSGSYKTNAGQKAVTLEWEMIRNGDLLGEASLEVYKEEKDGEITFLQIVHNGIIAEEPMDMLDTVHKWRIFDITSPDSIITAEITENNGEIHVSMSVCAEDMIDTIYEIMGGDIEELVAAFGSDIEITFKDILFLIVTDSDGNLLQKRTEIDVFMRGLMGRDLLEEVFEITFTSLSRFNRIGNVKIDMPYR
jgi:hypothetical protein